MNKPAGAKLTFEKFEREKITGVILSDPLLLASFDPFSEKVEVFELPANLYFDLGARGFYLASKVYQLEPGDNGVKLLTNSLEANFAIPIDFYLDFGSQNITREKVLEWKEKILEPASLTWFFQMPTKSSKVVKTNFTLFDQFKLLWQLRGVRGDKFNIQKVAAENFEEVTLPNGDKVVKVAQDGLSPEFVNKFADLRVSQEGLTVGIYNAAGKPGLAQTVAKICQNLGMHAVVSGDSDRVQTVSKILVQDDKMSSYTVRRLVKTFGGKVEKQQDKYLEDVVVLVGSDLADKLYFEFKLVE